MHLLAAAGVAMLFFMASYLVLFLIPLLVISYRYHIARYYLLSHPLSITELRLNHDDEFLISRKNGSQTKVYINHISSFAGSLFISFSRQIIITETIILNKEDYAEKDLHILNLRLRFQ